ncbi:heterokaryon incompatibility protein-domain-containing protein [Xylariales sp. PMI_506]|nr:heterokaryon incompatibility protein-domain-containing protein [Xylariales sp. PMI_506]
MRLLGAGNLELAEFVGVNIPRYAILSHTWEDDEVSFQDIQSLEDACVKKGFDKIVKCCEQARRDGLQWVWVDTCCIDKSSSAELTEAINSMYHWYESSAVCYAYFSDMVYEFPRLNSFVFSCCRWFSRGWTLQELIAPARVVFYDRNWADFGTKHSLRFELHQRTGIPLDVLSGWSPTSCSIAQRLSWVSDRVTTRPEDMAYCLMGLFNVNMPLLYGEGEQAFVRLMSEVSSKLEDYTMLIWTEEQDRKHIAEAGSSIRGALPLSPRVFARKPAATPSSVFPRMDKQGPLSYTTPQALEQYSRTILSISMVHREAEPPQSICAPALPHS